MSDISDVLEDNPSEFQAAVKFLEDDSVNGLLREERNSAQYIVGRAVENGTLSSDELERLFVIVELYSAVKTGYEMITDPRIGTVHNYFLAFGRRSVATVLNPGRTSELTEKEKEKLTEQTERYRKFVELNSMYSPEFREAVVGLFDEVLQAVPSNTDIPAVKKAYNTVARVRDRIANDEYFWEVHMGCIGSLINAVDRNAVKRRVSLGGLIKRSLRATQIIRGYMQILQ